MRPTWLDYRTEEEKNEYYGPIDGVQPADYPETYSLLNESYCFKKTPIIIYAETSYPWQKMCAECYEDRRLRYFDVSTNWHSICSKLYNFDLNDKLYCIFCGEMIIIFQNANECKMCIEQFLLFKSYFEVAERSQKHYEVEVMVRHY